MPLFADRIIAATWIIGGAIWVLLGLTAKRTRVWVPTTEQVVHYAVTGLGAYLFMAPRVRAAWLHLPLLPQNYFTAGIGLSLLAVGMMVMFWARTILGRNWSGIVTIKEDHQLIRRGPYAFVRHPIYTGILTALLGTTIALGQVRHVLGWLIVSVGLWLKSRVEERWLTQEFGAAYEAYRREVPAIIPTRRPKHVT